MSTSKLCGPEPESGFASDLFSVLLEPVVGDIPGPDLIVVPDGKLNLLPFDALRDSEGRFVLESHVVTYAPSATVLYLLRESRPARSRDSKISSALEALFTPVPRVNLAAMEQAPAANVSPTSSVWTPSPFRIFPEAHRKLLALPESLEARSNCSSKARPPKSAFKALPLSEFRIIHLAVHGVANAEFPDQGGTGSREFGRDPERTVFCRFEKSVIFPSAPNW